MYNINLKENLTLSKRGKKMLNYQGFSYNLVSTNYYRLYWRCSDRACHGKAHTDTLYNLIKIYDHCHDPNFKKANRKTLIDSLKSQALNTSETNRDIVYNKLVENPHLFLECNINLKYVKDVITKTRKKNNISYEKESDIPNETKFLTNGEAFYYHDTGVSNPNRIIILTTDFFLNCLCQAEGLIIDATFATVPHNFKQLLIIQASINNFKYNLMFVLMKNKNETSYNGVFTFMRNHINQINFSWILIDFEYTLYKCLAIYFPNIQIKGCWFHLNQLFQRKITEMGFKKIYKNNPNFNLHCKLILALAFVPLQNLESEIQNLFYYFKNLNITPSESLEVYDWFVKNFVFDVRFENHQPNVWNIYNQILQNIPITTNSLEAFNRHLNSIAETRHPSIYSLLSELKKESEFTNLKLQQNQICLKRKEVQTRKEVKILKEYGTLIGVNYLKKIVLFVRFAIFID